MSSYFDDASLVMIPSGYKTSKVYSVKPTDGTGDLTFTRSNSTASRVASNGLIEKVRTNLLLQSNSFGTTWGNVNSTETSGQSDPNGGTTAWLLTKSAATGQINISVSNTGETTFSLYMKAGTSQYGVLTIGAPRVYAFFDLSAGTTGFVTSGATSSITSIGGGWYRCSVTVGYCSYVEIYQSDTNATITGTTGTINIWSGQVEAGVMTDFIGNTTTAAVSVGPVANVPRLDYLDSSCPRLILEGQRTNLALFSEQLDNAAWIKTNVTIAANSTSSPDGYLGSDKVEENGGATGSKQVAQSFSQTASTYSFSLFAKKDERTELGIVTTGGGMATQETIFDLNAGTLVSGNGAIYDYGNGWFRCVQIFTTLDNTSILVRIRPLVSGSNSYTGVSGYGLYLWGAQLEQGSYATSYCPTLGASVTRGADACSKTGISSLIGQTEGTLFLEVDAVNFETDQRFAISDGTAANRIALRMSTGGVIQLSVVIGSATQASISGSGSVGNTYKIAGAYKANDFVLYINGSLVGTDTSGSVSGTFSRLATDNGLSGQDFYNPIKQALLFKTRLPNSSLAELTSL